MARRVDRRDDGRHVGTVRPLLRKVVGNVNEAAVRRDRRGDRLADNRHAGDFPASDQVDHRNVVVEAVADVEPRAVGANCRANRRMAGGNRAAYVAGGGFDQANRAPRRGTGDIERFPVRAQDHAGRRGGHVDQLRHFSAGGIHQGNLPCIGIGHEQAIAVARRDDRNRTQPGCGRGNPDSRQAGQSQQSAKKRGFQHRNETHDSIPTGDCPDFRGGKDVTRELKILAAKMGLSPLRRERGQVHVFGRRFLLQTRFPAEKWTSPHPGCERLRRFWAGVSNTAGKPAG